MSSLACSWWYKLTDRNDGTYRRVQEYTRRHYFSWQFSDIPDFSHFPWLFPDPIQFPRHFQAFPDKLSPCAWLWSLTMHYTLPSVALWWWRWCRFVYAGHSLVSAQANIRQEAWRHQRQRLRRQWRSVTHARLDLLIPTDWCYFSTYLASSLRTIK